MAQQTEGFDTPNDAYGNNGSGVIVRIENGPQIMFVDLDGNSSIGDLLKSPKMKNTQLYCGQYVVEGTKAPISKIARMEKDFYVVTAKYSNNKDANVISVGNVMLQLGVVYAIKSVSSGRYLDGRNKDHDNPLITNRNPKGDAFLHWTIVRTNGDNHYALKSVSSEFYLDGRNKNHDDPLITNRDPMNDAFLQWTFSKV